ncbi:primosomal protein N' [Natronospira bacteriovora]|uniref:Replication restart protein PriA n=1 Tax=Natronospira bacteriovora TaxID=3069753 RepID=A0ABU0W7L0_9GAMM|nr:primosomal protein N' [Natronospira sp. AB-CW4]MDQ2069932.1 primosomal protein N' [Natronospira sp. AB-CW4]
MSETVWRVAIPSPLRRLFDYLPPDTPVSGPVAGRRVRVPFGSRQLVGLVVETGEADPAMPRSRLRRISRLLDEAPVVPADMLRLALWSVSYYHHPPGEVLEHLLPVALRRGEAATRSAERWWQLSEEGRHLSPGDLARAPRQQRILARLQQAGGALPAAELQDLGEGWQGVMRRMEEKGLVAGEERGLTVALPSEPVDGGVALNERQQTAVEAISSHLDGFSCHLLEGVTGSGKTEVYLALMRRILAQGRQCLVLVPEIALTPQLTQRFRDSLPARIGLYHSGMNERERRDTWLAARDGELDVLIGTRSAVFLPLKHPGLMILDEEHDPAFKQQDGFRYSARDLALVRARQQALPVVLGSATPSLESLRNARDGRYQALALPKRAGKAKPPLIRTVDLRGQDLDGGLSGQLLTALDRHLRAGNQALLFLNRRGYAPVLICNQCGWTADCSRCDARMTYHRGRGSLDCHHCGNSRRLPRACPECASEKLGVAGQGTEKLEQVLSRRFPDVGVVRIDRDTTRRRGEMDARLQAAREGRARLLIGTQMLAKGHDFPDLTLVGLVDADQGLMSADFRGPERTAQLITQVAGRAGRGEKPGEVLIQTRVPDHPLLETLIQGGYGAFADAALRERNEAGFPPYSHLALLRAEAHQREAVNAFLEEAVDEGSRRASQELLLMGPVPAPMERRAGRYRAQVLIQAEARPALHALLRDWAPWLEGLKSARKVRWSLDVDPIDLF